MIRIAHISDLHVLARRRSAAMLSGARWAAPTSTSPLRTGESELLVVVEDPVQVAGFEAQIDGLLAGSTLVKRDDLLWQHAARRRAWMRHWPGLLSA